MSTKLWVVARAVGFVVFVGLMTYWSWVYVVEPSYEAEMRGLPH
jgi:hypothetical protein